MRYRYAAAYGLKGAMLPGDASDVVVVEDVALRIQGIVTSDVDAHLFEADRRAAVANMILNGVFGDAAEKGTLADQMNSKITEVRDRRKKRFGGGAFLVISGEGSVDCFEPTNECETDEFVVCFEGAPTVAIRERFASATTAMVSALVMKVESLLAVEKVADAVVFFRDDGKPVYSYSPSFSASGYASRPLNTEDLAELPGLYVLLTADDELMRVQGLLRSSLEAETDQLRSFLSAWSAAEILINKVFALYENKFFGEIADEEHSDAQRRYLARIREVMKDKYRLLDKFAAIAFQLSPGAADADLLALGDAKDLRDKLLHGQSVDEASLPAKLTRDLTARYLIAHLETHLPAAPGEA